MISDELYIRQVNLEDAAMVASLEAECLGQEAWSEKSFYDSLGKECYSFFAAFIGDVHVGTVGFTKSLDEADVSNVCVARAHRKKGIASRLLQHGIDELAKQGILHFTLEVREKNDSALNLYKKLGFESAGIRPDFYSNPNDNAVIMWKHL